MDKENVAHLHNGVLDRRKNNEILNFAGKWMKLENNDLYTAHVKGDARHLPSNP